MPDVVKHLKYAFNHIHEGGGMVASRNIDVGV